MTGPPIKSVAAHRGYILRVEWRNGSATLLNMRPRLQSPRFGALRNEAVWKSVTTDGQTIRWIDDIGFSYEMAINSPAGCDPAEGSNIPRREKKWSTNG